MSSGPLKDVLTEMVNHLEKLTAAVAVVESKATDKRTAYELAVQSFAKTHDELRRKIAALP
jgi:hypothetical protein